MSAPGDPGYRPDQWGTAGDHEKRIRALEALLFSSSTPGRIVAGAIDNDANILGGTGFTVIRTNPNIYTITFDTPFTNPPIVALTGNNNNPVAGSPVGEYGVTLRAAGTWLATSIQVMTVAFDGTATDAGFHFWAIEAET